MEKWQKKLCENTSHQSTRGLAENNAEKMPKIGIWINPNQTAVGWTIDPCQSFNCRDFSNRSIFDRFGSIGRGWWTTPKSPAMLQSARIKKISTDKRIACLAWLTQADYKLVRIILYKKAIKCGLKLRIATKNLIFFAIFPKEWLIFYHNSNWQHIEL